MGNGEWGMGNGTLKKRVINKAGWKYSKLAYSNPFLPLCAFAPLRLCVRNFPDKAI
jgi:hypothetical protein